MTIDKHPHQAINIWGGLPSGLYANLRLKQSQIWNLLLNVLPSCVFQLDGDDSDNELEPDQPDDSNPGLLPHQWTLSVPPSHLIDRVRYNCQWPEQYGRLEEYSKFKFAGSGLFFSHMYKYRRINTMTFVLHLSLGTTYSATKTRQPQHRQKQQNKVHELRWHVNCSAAWLPGRKSYC